jgi:hypothetical protein
MMRQQNFNKTYKNITFKKFGGRSQEPENSGEDADDIQIVFTKHILTVMTP